MTEQAQTDQTARDQEVEATFIAAVLAWFVENEQTCPSVNDLAAKLGRSGGWWRDWWKRHGGRALHSSIEEWHAPKPDVVSHSTRLFFKPTVTALGQFIADLQPPKDELAINPTLSLLGLAKACHAILKDHQIADKGSAWLVLNMMSYASNHGMVGEGRNEDGVVSYLIQPHDQEMRTLSYDLVGKRYQMATLEELRGGVDTERS